MAEFTDTLTDKHIAFIEKQPVYFTATAAEKFLEKFDKICIDRVKRFFKTFTRTLFYFL